MHLLVAFRIRGSPPPENLKRFFSITFLSEAFVKNVRFGRSLAQLILGALSIHPFGVKEGPARCFLSDVPFGPFRLPSPKSTSVRGGASLVMHLLVGFPHPWLAAFQKFLASFFALFGRFPESLASCLRKSVAVSS